ncbi:MAG: L,D-transpeptidase family protein, partial [Bacilli bacterium]|nr:L,D-transpeptidase family protein [Bacilli bacterium]
KNKQLDSSTLGYHEITIKLQNILKQQSKYKYKILVKDTVPPQISYTKEITITEGTNIDLLKDVKVTDNSNEQITATIRGDYDFNTPGQYELKYIAEDSSHNKTEEDFLLIVNKKVVQKQQTPKNPTSVVAESGYPYYIKVNRSNNVVLVYGIENGQYSNLVKVFTASASTKTPLGNFRTSQKYVWKVLIGPVWGQYSTRITGQILFHSVPYTKQTKDSLEYWEYNLLGNHRSLGCIRLTVEDAKWIYDNCPLGTQVEIYDGPLNGIEKPSTPKIDTNSPNRGWDPTDPDPNNPWKAS